MAGRRVGEGSGSAAKDQPPVPGQTLARERRCVNGQSILVAVFRIAAQKFLREVLSAGKLSGNERARRVAVKLVNERDPEHRRTIAALDWWHKRNAQFREQRATGWAYIQSLRNPLQ